MGGAGQRSQVTSAPVGVVGTARVASALALYASIGGAAALAGWFFDVERLADWDGDGLSTQPNTAVLLLLSGIALLCVQGRARRLGVALGALVGIVGALLVLQFVLGADLGFNSPMAFGRRWGHAGTLAPGRAGPPASICFVLIGAGLVLMGGGSHRMPSARRWVAGLGVAVCTVMTFSLVGYVVGARTFFALPGLSFIASHTATMLFALGAALVVVVPEHEPMRTLLAGSRAGFAARRALPVLIIVSLIATWFGAKGEALGLYDAATARAWTLTIFLLVSVGLLWRALLAWGRREEAQAASEHRVGELLGSITDGFLSLDRDWRFTFLNDVMVERLGGPRERLLGGNLWELFPEVVKTEAHSQLGRAMADRIAVEYEMYYPPWQRWFRDNAYPMADGGLAVYSRDITDRKAADAALIRSQTTLHELVEQAPFGVYIVDAGFRIAQMNRGSQHGAFANVRPVIGRDFADAMRILWPEDVAVEIIATFRRTLETGEPFRSADYVHPRADIEAVEAYEWELHRILLADGSHGVVCYYYDSTRLRLAEQSLKRAIESLRDADRAKDEFLATLAHELRNPLAPVRNAVHLLRRLGPATAELQWARDVIERQVEQMTRLIDDLLDVSRISRGRIEMRRERIDLASVVAHAVEASRPFIDAGRHELLVHLPAEPMWLDADVARMAQAICNLLNNAAKYSEPGGLVVLSARRLDQEVEISVRDTGVGIPPDMLTRVFDMFTQVDATLDKSQGGLGIGLTLTKRLVELHGGRIEARSDGVGLGSEFVVHLPLAADATLSQPKAQPATSLPPVRPLRIVVVDDNRDGADSLALALQLAGHETRTAHDGLQGLEIAEEFRPEVALLDLGLPGMDGFDLARAIRRRPWGAGVVLVAITGWGQAEDRRRSREAGFDHHLTKPLAPQQLLELLQSIAVRAPSPHTRSAPEAEARP